MRLALGAVLICLALAGSAAAESCRASFYGAPGERLNRFTASGERFNPRALTAAHRSLPFGTLIGVRAYARGRPLGPKITLRVNDRGPAPWTGRGLDVTRAAARALGFERAGTAIVEIERLQ